MNNVHVTLTMEYDGKVDESEMKRCMEDALDSYVHRNWSIVQYVSHDVEVDVIE